MKFRFVDILVSGASLIVILCLAYGASFLLTSAFTVPLEYRGILVIFSFFVCLSSFTLFFIRIVRFCFPMKEGVFNLEEGGEITIWKLQGFMYLFNLGILMNTYLIPVNIRWLVYNLCGATISSNVMIGGKIIDPMLVEIGEYSILGEDAVVTCHAIEGNTLTLKKIKIGKNVTVGVKAVILPGVDIGNHAVIACGAVVAKDTKIGPYEVWGGMPARKIGERK